MVCKDADAEVVPKVVVGDVVGTNVSRCVRLIYP